MITGGVTADREATIVLEMRGTVAQPAAITAVIDTGFTGSLTLPSALINSLALVRIGARRATLADGSRVNLETYEATVLWDGQTLDVLAPIPFK
jgi:clan AA aspartic protease